MKHHAHLPGMICIQDLMERKDKSISENQGNPVDSPDRDHKILTVAET